MNGIFSFPRLSIISHGARPWTVSGSGYVTVRAAALLRTHRAADQRPPLRLCSWNLRTDLSPGRRRKDFHCPLSTPAVGRVRLFSSCNHFRLEDEVKEELASGASRIRWSCVAFLLLHRPAPRFTSLCYGKKTTCTGGSNGFYASYFLYYLGVTQRWVECRQKSVLCKV